RRHTRFSRDWSSDVCSSDLGADAGVVPEQALGLATGQRNDIETRAFVTFALTEEGQALAIRRPGERRHTFLPSHIGAYIVRPIRSEERRVGKERSALSAPAR